MRPRWLQMRFNSGEPKLNPGPVPVSALHPARASDARRTRPFRAADFCRSFNSLHIQHHHSPTVTHSFSLDGLTSRHDQSMTTYAAHPVEPSGELSSRPLVPHVELQSSSPSSARSPSTPSTPPSQPAAPLASSPSPTSTHAVDPEAPPERDAYHHHHYIFKRLRQAVAPPTPRRQWIIT